MLFAVASREEKRGLLRDEAGKEEDGNNLLC